MTDRTFVAVFWQKRSAVGAAEMRHFDLIPDFIPAAGQLDDLMITPLRIALALRLTPPEILAEARARAETEIALG